MKFNICDEIDKEFVKKYDNLEEKNIYENWKNLSKHTLVRKNEVKSSIDDVFLGGKAIKNEIALNIIHKFTSDTISNSINKTFSKNHFVNVINEICDHIKQNKEQFNLLFDRNYQPQEYEKTCSKTKRVNKILESTYGLKIERIETDRENYIIKLKNLFILENNTLKVNPINLIIETQTDTQSSNNEINNIE